MKINENWNCPSIYNLNNLNKHEVLFEKAKKEGYENVVLMDDGTLHHLSVTFDAARQYDMKVIIGCKIPFRIGLYTVTLALIPWNNKALKKLYYLSTEYQEKNGPIRLEGKKKWLAEMNIVIDAQNIDEKTLRAVLQTLCQITSKGHIHVGIAEDIYQHNKEKNLTLKQVLKEEKIGYIPFHSVLYVEEQDEELYVDLMRIKENSFSDETYFCFLKPTEIQKAYNYMDGVPNHSEKILQQTNIHVDSKKESLKVPTYRVDNPKFAQTTQFLSEKMNEQMKTFTKQEIMSANYLMYLVLKGIKNKYGENHIEAIKRAKHELEIIISKKFSDYFLIVWDMIDYAIKQKIPLGPGRGSSVASIVAYVLEVTKIDPLEYQLQFERFLNPYRTDFPDIDIDVSQRDRGKLINYLRKKYGDDKVSQILTKNNYGHRNILNYMPKIMRIPEDVVSAVKSMKGENYDSYDELVESFSAEQKEFLENHKDARIMLERAYELRDVPQGFSKHSSGVILSSEPLKMAMPMMFEGAEIFTQIPNDNKLNSLEKFGMLKVDILASRMIDVLEDTKRLVKHRYNKKEVNIVPEDKKVFDMLSEGNTVGVFQLESASHFAKMVGIESFNDIVVLNALNRPGPMENIPLFAERKGKPIKLFAKGKELNNVECLYPILQETNGVIVYQEQINEIVVEWAGFTLGEAELFRRAVSKKQGDVLKAKQKEFVDRALKKGRDKKTTLALYDLILLFSNYGFNKSHAVAYSYLSYESAYLKKYYPTEFLTSLLNSLVNETKKSSTFMKYMEEARRLGIELLPPDINISTDKFFIAGEKQIRCPLQLVKNIGQAAAREIMMKRGIQPFRHIEDFKKRMADNNLNASHFESLIRSGVFDSLASRIVNLKKIGIPVEKMSFADKVRDELNYCSMIFSVPEEQRSLLLVDKEKEPNKVAGIVLRVIEKKDKYKRDMASVQLLDLEGKTHYFAVFHRFWKKCVLKEDDVIVGNVENNAFSSLEKIETKKKGN